MRNIFRHFRRQLLRCDHFDARIVSIVLLEFVRGVASHRVITTQQTSIPDD